MDHIETGLLNSGATCYRNCVLQLLKHADCVRTTISRLRNLTLIGIQVRDLFRNMDSNCGGVVDPATFDAIIDTVPAYRHGVAADAGFFMDYLDMHLSVTPNIAWVPALTLLDFRNPAVTVATLLRSMSPPGGRMVTVYINRCCGTAVLTTAVVMPLDVIAGGEIYCLHGTLCHTGTNSGSGHYRALIRSQLTGIWTSCDDTHCETVWDGLHSIRPDECAVVAAYIPRVAALYGVLGVQR